MKKSIHAPATSIGNNKCMDIDKYNAVLYTTIVNSYEFMINLYLHDPLHR